MRRLVNVHTTKSPFATAPSTFVPATDTSRIAVSGAGDGRLVVGQVRARAGGLTDRPFADADRVGAGRCPVAAARQHLPVQEQVEDAGIAGRRGDLPQLDDRRTVSRRPRRGHGLARECPGERGRRRRTGSGRCRSTPGSEPLRLAAAAGRRREPVRCADRDLNREAVVVAIAPDRLLGNGASEDDAFEDRHQRLQCGLASVRDRAQDVLVRAEPTRKPWRSPLRRPPCRRSGRRSA